MGYGKEATEAAIKYAFTKMEIKRLVTGTAKENFPSCKLLKSLGFTKVMENKGRAQCLVTRGNKILMVKHKQYGIEYYCLPGGGIEHDETAENAAIKELQEECNVSGTNLKLISTVIHDNHFNYTFYADIGSQEPILGVDPECMDNPILVGLEWRTLNEVCERDRAYLWAAGLFYVDEFAIELDSWGDDISYPSNRRL